MSQMKRLFGIKPPTGALVFQGIVATFQPGGFKSVIYAVFDKLPAGTSQVKHVKLILPIVPGNRIELFDKM